MQAEEEDILVREATRDDLSQAVELIVRMKRLNGEFDPMFRVVENISERALQYLTDSLGSENAMIWVATAEKRVIGILRAEIRDRLFYEPEIEGLITDFYILPEGRRKALGNNMILAAAKRLKERGAQIITAEFPAQNEIAAKFYSKRGFRALVNFFAREDSQ
jgi:ribosomal protein S18 acetylase RimI-like enzyme